MSTWKTAEARSTSHGPPREASWAPLAGALSVLVACAPSPNPSPVGPSPPTASSAVPSVPPPPTLSVFAEGWEVTVAETHGPVVVHDRLLGAMVAVDGERIARVPAPFQWLPTGPGVTGTITGGWPEGALLTLGSDRALLQLFRRAKGTWEKQELVGHVFRTGYRITNSDSDSSYLDASTAPAPDGRSLVFVYGSSLVGHPLVSLGGDGAPTTLGDVSLMETRQFVALPEGRIAVLGVDLNEEWNYKAWFVERWRPGDTVHEKIEVPDTVGADASTDASRHSSRVTMCPARDQAVHVVRHVDGSSKCAFLALRGKAWDVHESEISEFPAKTKVHVQACAVAQDGATWVLLDSDKSGVGGLFRRTLGGAVEHVPYPLLPALSRWPRFVPTEGRSRHYRLEYPDTKADKRAPARFRGGNVFVADDASVWIDGVRWEDGAAVQNDDVEGFHLTRRAVLRVGPPLPGTPIDWEAFAPGILEARLAAYNAQGGVSHYDWLGAERVSPKCGTEVGEVFARLSTLPRSTSAVESFPAVRALVYGRNELAGVRFVEARIDDVHVLGAFVPSVKVGRLLLSVLKGRIPSAGARLYCGVPHVVRAIPMGVAGE